MRKYPVMLLLMFAYPAFAAANKWIDASGQVHYSDKMPPQQAIVLKTIGSNTPDTPIDTSASGVSATSSVTATSTKADKEKEAAAAKKAAAAKAEQEAAIKAQNQANCAGAKQNLANLKDGMRIATVDPTTGERAYMDDAQRAKSMEDAQQQISKFCQ